MLTSTLAALKIMAAANMLTLMVLPNLRGVLISTSWARWFQPFFSRMAWWSLANWPLPSTFQKTLAVACMKASWNFFWKKDLSQPCLSMHDRASLQASILVKPVFGLAPPSALDPFSSRKARRACSFPLALRPSPASCTDLV